MSGEHVRSPPGCISVRQRIWTEMLKKTIVNRGV